MGTLLFFDSLFSFYSYSFILSRTVCTIFIGAKVTRKKSGLGFTLRFASRFSVFDRHLNVIFSVLFFFEFILGGVFGVL